MHTRLYPIRQMREREKGVKEKLKLAGTTLGNIMGVKEDERDDEQKVREDAEKAAQGGLHPFCTNQCSTLVHFQYFTSGKA